jgi:hypothetical protein
VSADEKDENDAPLDLSEWEPQSPPSDFAERVLAKVKPPKAAQRRKPWVKIAGGVVGTLAEGVPFSGPIILNLSDADGGFPTAPKGKVDFHQIYDLSSTPAFAVNAATDKPFSAEDLLPLDLREIVLHGGFLAEGQGFGPGEADGTAGYKTVLPVAAGVINATTAPVPLPASVWLIAAGLGGLGALRARRKAAA